MSADHGPHQQPLPTPPPATTGSGTAAPRTALITGAGSGIGRACAQQLAAVGTRVLVADLPASGGEQTVADVAAAGGDATFHAADVSRQADADAMVAACLDAYGGLDCAVNCAGILRIGGTLECSEADWQAVLAVNLTGVWHSMRAELPPLLAAGGGSIVNVASIYGVVASASNAAYTASKHGVVGLTKSAALQYGPANIRVNAVCPGHTNTAMNEALLLDPQWVSERTARYPLQRLAEPEEVARMIVWACSEAASFVTGQTLLVDGGYTAG